MYEVKVYVQQVRKTITTPHYVAFPYFVAESSTSHLNPLVSCYWDTEIVTTVSVDCRWGPVRPANNIRNQIEVT